MRRLTPWRLINVSLALLGLMAVIAYFIAGGFEDKPAFGTVRVNQLGYLVNESKVAYVMTGSSVADESFEVRTRPGDKKVFSGKIADDPEVWSSNFGAVHRIDFSQLTEPGSYRIKIRGSINANSPTFRIDSGGNLYTDQVHAALSGYFATQRDDDHPSDSAATAYQVPGYSSAGKLDKELQPDTDRGPVDVSGGWYDGSGYVKFVHSASYTAICLALGLDGWEDAQLRSEMEYGLNWLTKMWDPQRQVLYSQVGLLVGNSDIRGDEDAWRNAASDAELAAQPGDQDYFLKNRPVFAANEPGAAVPTNLAGRYAAAFALAAVATADDTQARGYLERAAEVYQAASPDPAAVHTGYPSDAFREDSGADDMSLAAASLARAGGRFNDGRAAQWLVAAQEWDGKYQRGDYSQIGMADVSLFADLQTALASQGEPRSASLAQVADALQQEQNTAAKHPFGTTADKDVLDTVTPLGVAVAADDYQRIADDTRFTAVAAAQRAYVFGANAWGVSFVIGTGEDSPQCPHHAEANSRSEPDLVRGGVVGTSLGRWQISAANDDDIIECRQDRERYDGTMVKYLDDARMGNGNEPTIDSSATALLVMARAAR